jgi:hypothetical protein
MYHTGIDPMSMKPIEVAKGARQRAMQRALMQYFMPSNYHLVREALRLAGREDLIGDGPQALIPGKPPAGAGKRAADPRRRGRGRRE